MDINRAKEILVSLADGVDPLTGEILPEKSICNQPDIIRAFHCILNQLQQKEIHTTRSQAENAGKPWSEEDDERLGRMFDNGCRPKEMQTYFKRSRGSIEARLVHIGKVQSREEARY